MKIKTAISSALLAAGLLSLTSCSSPTKVDSGAIHAQTFSFITQNKPAPAYADNRAEIHAMVQKSISDSLAKRMVNKVDQRGDVIVAYLIIVGNNATTTSLNDYFGYGRDAAALVDKAHSKSTSSDNPNYFEAGTLVIDILDGKTFKLLRRNYATRALINNPTPEQQAKRINEVVEEILADAKFRP